ncbi:hypothetical protein H072_5980 [Dactylellina haptotyla CBS 200.50]|uniref:tRNA-splicing endonuclease subunit Sen54 N-terminal domain-containing protein n=1 Tax=Dactylellina haptotyla (strain CBS 200.50) TaxID=1284197 RepID=S8AB45_DACHA|nr:hypothetical protein H072_5980 [Dactylellina haptotyla CBS 200.50]
METDGVSGGLEDVDIDLSDETQDFRFLAALTKKGGSIPKRGEKDFEPDGTNLQSNSLDDSRNAMFEALAVERMHTGKNRVTATWHPSRGLAKVHTQRGVLFKSMGRADKFGTMWLLPEELIYMVERGSLECFYEDTPGVIDESIGINVPMSVQAVYAATLEFTGGLERYQVYANLRRSGYVVYRNPDGQYDELFKTVGYEYKPVDKSNQGWRVWGLVGIFGSLFTQTFQSGWTSARQGDPFRPMIPPGAYRTYAEMYTRLLVPRPPAPKRIEGDAHFNVTFHVWKPRPNFKKSAPGPPDFHVCVVSTKDTRLPSLLQVEGLFGGIPETEDSEKPKNMFMALKDGRRGVILAVVDYGVISFMKFSDSRFMDHKLDVDPPPKGAKGKAPARNFQAKGGQGKKR